MGHKSFFFMFLFCTCVNITQVHDIESLLKDHGSHRVLSLTFSCEFLKNDKAAEDVVPTARKDGTIKYKDQYKSALVSFETKIRECIYLLFVSIFFFFM